MRRIVAAVSVAASALAVVPAARPAAASHLVAAQLEVGQRTFEPTIGAGPDGTLYYSVTPPPGLLAGFGAGMYASTDGGATWRDISPRVGSRRIPPETNDPYIYVDPETGRAFNFHMSPILTCSMLSFTDDAGQSWTTNPAGCGPTGVWDHQTMVAANPRVLVPVGYPNIVHQCVNAVYAAMCSRSLNGGLTWSPSTPAYPNTEHDPDEGAVCGAMHGHLKAAPDGTLYLPRFPRCVDAVVVYVSRDDGLSWERSVVSPTEPMSYDPEVAVDAAGNAYVAWIEADGGVRLAISRDEGRTWGAPVVASAPGITGALPTMAAGADGRVVLAYPGTPDLPQGYLTPGYLEGAADFSHLRWYGYLSVSVDASGASPTFETVASSQADDPLMRGRRCVQGPNCTFQQDFIDVVIAPNGRPYAAFVDACRDACATPGGTEGDHTGFPAWGVVGTLTQGPSLR